MHHTVGPSKKRILESEEQIKLLPLYKILKQVGFCENMTLLDIGAGVGYFYEF